MNYDINQLLKWAMGENSHSRSGSCCPDYKCCRADFVTADRKAKSRFIRAFSEDDIIVMRHLEVIYYSQIFYPKIVASKLDHTTVQ